MTLRPSWSRSEANECLSAYGVVCSMPAGCTARLKARRRHDWYAGSDHVSPSSGEHEGVPRCGSAPALEVLAERREESHGSVLMGLRVGVLAERQRCTRIVCARTSLQWSASASLGRSPAYARTDRRVA